MDEFSGTLLNSEDLDGDPPIPYDLLDLKREVTGSDNFPVGVITVTTNSTSPTRGMAADDEYTQTMSILAFSSLVLFAIIAYIFSKHCLFKEKPPAVSGTASSTGTNSNPQNSQFNFLGSRGAVRGIVATVNNNTPSVARPDDLPPSYDELFPPEVVVVVESRTYQHPAPPYSLEEQKPQEEETKEEKGKEMTTD